MPASLALTIGVVIGTSFGIFLMSLLIMSRRSQDNEELDELRLMKQRIIDETSAYHRNMALDPNAATSYAWKVDLIETINEIVRGDSTNG